MRKHVLARPSTWLSWPQLDGDGPGKTEKTSQKGGAENDGGLGATLDKMEREAEAEEALNERLLNGEDVFVEPKRTQPRKARVEDPYQYTDARMQELEKRGRTKVSSRRLFEQRHPDPEKAAKLEKRLGRRFSKQLNRTIPSVVDDRYAGVRGRAASWNGKRIVWPSRRVKEAKNRLPEDNSGTFHHETFHAMQDRKSRALTLPRGFDTPSGKNSCEVEAYVLAEMANFNEELAKKPRLEQSVGTSDVHPLLLDDDPDRGMERFFEIARENPSRFPVMNDLLPLVTEWRESDSAGRRAAGDRWYEFLRDTVFGRHG